MLSTIEKFVLKKIRTPILFSVLFLLISTFGKTFSQERPYVEKIDISDG
jgi:hypothetical protein